MAQVLKIMTRSSSYLPLLMMPGYKVGPSCAAQHSTRTHTRTYARAHKHLRTRARARARAMLLQFSQAGLSVFEILGKLNIQAMPE
jgi:hypothetical protein